ncbi:MAG: DMT family transporter [Silicimonas sp.]|nr:DMT family transporter [Silicimonas sp.]
MVAILGFVWGASFLFVELALESVTPFWIAAFRIALAGLVTSIVWQLRGRKLYLTAERGSWVVLVTVGLLSTAVPFMALSWGQQVVTAGFAGVTMAAVALMVLPLAHFLVPGERLNLRKTLGFMIGFVGVVILIGPDAFRSTGVEGELAGRLACLLAAGCYAVSSILMRRIPPIDPVGLSAVTLWIGAALVVVAALLAEGWPGWPTGMALLVIVTLGLVQTAAANMLRIQVVRTAGPVFMSLTNYQVPLWSVILGVLVLGEPLEASLFLAMTLILAGVGLSQWGALKRLFGHAK